jgi:hypothetical protein
MGEIVETIKKLNTIIDGYNVDLIIEDDKTSCIVSSGDWRFSTDLDLLMSYAALTNNNYSDSMTVAQKTINKIEHWVINNDY